MKKDITITTIQTDTSTSVEISGLFGYWKQTPHVCIDGVTRSSPMHYRFNGDTPSLIPR